MTFQGLNVTKRIVERLSVRDLLVATRDDAPTRTEQISLIVSATPFKSKNFLVVGDRLNDVYLALNLGCEAALVDRRGKYDPNKIGKGFAVISSLRKLYDLLEPPGKVNSSLKLKDSF